MQELEAAKADLNNSISKFKKKRSKAIRRKNIKPTTSSKEFWRIVNEKNSHDGVIKTYKTKDKKLTLDHDEMEKAILK